MAIWQVQQAKARFSEVLDDAETKGPQIITRHGTERAVVLSIEEYRDLSEKKFTDAPQSSLIHFLLHEGPKFEDGDNPFDNLRDPNDLAERLTCDIEHALSARHQHHLRDSVTEAGL